MTETMAIPVVWLVEAGDHARHQPYNVRIEIDDLGFRVEATLEFAEKNKSRSIQKRIGFHEVAQARINLLCKLIDDCCRPLAAVAAAEAER
jgi:hypothetical protein